ncbi:hypothetical protein ALC62_15654 [Cyphomyrmex costatus]|uniref:Uncharacterized protein n=1 Tax=Cyphomyrmex costatus TaxID=456900 RepID=A0A151I774_9HYME|nr:hypothetical protein ALC62_15654 [Cyphomyrmex costatus]
MDVDEDVNVEDVMEVESSDDSVLSVDTGCVSDRENATHRVQKIIPDAQIRALGVFRVKHCQIQCYTAER